MHGQNHIKFALFHLKFIRVRFELIEITVGWKRPLFSCSVLNLTIDVSPHHECAATQTPGLRAAVMRQTAVHVQRPQKLSK